MYTHTKSCFCAEALQTLLGLVRWLMDIMSLTISDLFELAKATKGKTGDLQFVRQKGYHYLSVIINYPKLADSLLCGPQSSKETPQRFSWLLLVPPERYYATIAVASEDWKQLPANNYLCCRAAKLMKNKERPFVASRFRLSLAQ